jgi:hypothetical protein
VARAVLATVTSAEAMTPAIEGLAVRGRLVVVGVSPMQLISASRSVVGHASGASIDSQDTLALSTRSARELGGGLCADDVFPLGLCAGRAIRPTSYKKTWMAGPTP